MPRLGRMVEEVVGRAYRYASWRLTERGLTRNPVIRWASASLHRYFEARSIGRPYQVNGFRMVLPQSDIGLGIRGFSERFVTGYFQQTVKPGMRVVEVVCLDEYFGSLEVRTIDAVKIDIEGGEYFALQGMARLLRESRGVHVVMEYSPQILARVGVALDAPLRLMRDLGFSIWEIGR